MRDAARTVLICDTKIAKMRLGVCHQVMVLRKNSEERVMRHEHEDG